MKQYITLVAYLVAGTTFASAATSISWEDLLACNVTFLNSTQTTIGSSLTLTAGERVQFDVSDLGIDFSKDEYVFTLAVEDFLVGNGPMIAWGTETGTTVAAQQYGFGASGNNNSCWAATINGSNMSQRYGSSMSYANTGLNGANTLDGIFTITIGTASDEGLLSVTFVDADSGTSYRLTPSGGLTMNDFSSGSVIKSITLGGWASTANNGTAMTILSIPEPSAFGLLAGLGALALAGARRRKKA